MKRIPHPLGERLIRRSESCFDHATASTRAAMPGDSVTIHTDGDGLWREGRGVRGVSEGARAEPPQARLPRYGVMGSCALRSCATGAVHGHQGHLRFRRRAQERRTPRRRPPTQHSPSGFSCQRRRSHMSPTTDADPAADGVPSAAERPWPKKCGAIRDGDDVWPLRRGTFTSMLRSPGQHHTF